VSQGINLSAAQYTSSTPLWSTTVAMTIGAQVQYKFIRVSSSGAVTWESDPNRSYTVPSDCSQSYTVESTWR
jgi:alpha-amylase